MIPCSRKRIDCVHHICHDLRCPLGILYRTCLRRESASFPISLMFCNGVALVGRFQGPGQQSITLASISRLSYRNSAGRVSLAKMPPTVAAARNTTSGRLAASHSSVSFCRRKSSDAAIDREDLAPLAAKPPHEGLAHHPAVAGDPHAPVGQAERDVEVGSGALPARLADRAHRELPVFLRARAQPAACGRRPPSFARVAQTSTVCRQPSFSRALAGFPRRATTSVGRK